MTITVLTKKISSLHKRAKLIEDGVLLDSTNLDLGLIYHLNKRFTDDRNELVMEACIKVMEEEYNVQDKDTNSADVFCNVKACSREIREDEERSDSK
ncbi:10491_t:CDS:2 [Paraglomus occultum]|uniref:10491_t:CDS:1 n=1 Tax=Paraglomus occultum TaxID=144539 RepID=A0A9N8ZZI9_9GLOM|nr:10491_t:CDS:2 [Paraglomus occultum]